MTVVELLAQIARRDNTRSEATLQADIRQLVLTAPLSLSAERRRHRGPGDPGRRPPADRYRGRQLPDRGQAGPRRRERPARCDRAARRLPDDPAERDRLPIRRHPHRRRRLAVRLSARGRGGRPAARGFGLQALADQAGPRVVSDLAGGRAGHGPGHPGDAAGDRAAAGGGKLGPRPRPRHAARALHAASRPSRRADEAAPLGPVADDRTRHPVRGQRRTLRRAHVPGEHGRDHRPCAGRLRSRVDRAGVAAERRQVRGERHRRRRRGRLLRLGRSRPRRRTVRPLAGPPRGPLPLAGGRRRRPQGALRVGHHGADPEASRRVLHARLARRADRLDHGRAAAGDNGSSIRRAAPGPSSSMRPGVTSPRPKRPVGPWRRHSPA